MRRRLVVGIGCIIVAGLGIAFALPASRYPLLGFLRQERMVNGRPITYWLAVMKEDENPEERRRAALSLGEAEACKDGPKDDPRCRAVVAALAGALGDPDGFVRKCAATSFLVCPKERIEIRSSEPSVAGDSVLVARLLAALSDQEVAVRKAAVRALWQVEPPPKQADVVARVTEALADKDESVRKDAARVLARIGPPAKGAVPALLERLRQDDESDVRKLAGKTLGLIGAEAIGPLLPETVAALTQGLKDKSPEFREYSARALGQLGAREALPALQKAVKDSDERVRSAAAEAVQRVKD